MSTLLKIKIDRKHRVELPPEVCESLGVEIVISRSGYKRVRLWHEDKWQEFSSKLKETPEKPLVTSIEKHIVRDAQKVQVDRLGRVHLPSRFLQWLDLEKDD